MGKDVSRAGFTHDDRVRYRHKVRRCLDVFALMLHDFRFDADHPMTGLMKCVEQGQPDVAKPDHTDDSAAIVDLSCQIHSGRLI